MIHVGYIKGTDSCLHGSSSHSLIMDVMDPCWEIYFTPGEMEEIRKYHRPQLKPLPVEVEEYLNKFAGVVCPLSLLFIIYYLLYTNYT